MKRKIPSPCKGGCEHSDLEHHAFDRGVRDGEAGVDENPYTRFALRDAWFTGHSVGQSNRKAAA